MVQANNGDTVQIHYTGKLKDGTAFDTSDGRDPLQITIGENTLMPKLEEAIVGMTLGDTKTVELAAADAFGPRQPDAVQTVDRSMIPEGVNVAIGNRLEAATQDGQTMILTVVAVDDATVTLDSNHPLAGQDLIFEIELVAIVDQAS